MPKRVARLVVCVFAVVSQAHGQQVIVESPRANNPQKKASAQAVTIVKAVPVTDKFPKAQPVKETAKSQSVAASATVTAGTPTVRSAPAKMQTAGTVAAPLGPKSASVEVQAGKSSNQPSRSTTAAVSAVNAGPNESAHGSSPSAKSSAIASTAPNVSASVPPSLAATAKKMRLIKVDGPASDPESHLPFSVAESGSHGVNTSFDTAFTKLADGFDFPIGKPDAEGYYKARGFRSHGHLGEDWDGIRGGDTDLGDPIYSIGEGIVVFARDCHMGWGNVVIVRHAFRENGTVKNVDALYGHLNSMLVKRGQSVSRGQKIATMGNAHGLYDAHLHLEIRKNIEIGMSRAAFARDFSNYYDPSQFIAAHRHLPTGGTYRVALNTFVHDSKINFDKARNYSHSHDGGGTGESAAALKKAVARKN